MHFEIVSREFFFDAKRIPAGGAGIPGMHFSIMPFPCHAILKCHATFFAPIWRRRSFNHLTASLLIFVLMSA
jgi:hypothetical protein